MSQNHLQSIYLNLDFIIITNLIIYLYNKLFTNNNYVVTKRDKLATDENEAFYEPPDASK